MSKEERKLRRAKNKEKRQSRKELRKAKFKEFIEKIKDAPELPTDSDPDYVEKFNEYWPTVKAGLEYAEAMKITGKKTDAKIGDIITLGDDVANNGDAHSEFRDKLENIWKYVRYILIAITVFITNDEQDEKIDKFIEIGDWFSGYAE